MKRHITLHLIADDGEGVPVGYTEIIRDLIMTNDGREARLTDRGHLVRYEVMEVERH